MSGSPRSLFRFPDGGWCCTRGGVTEPCGDCDGCRYVKGVNLAERAIRAKAGATTSPVYQRKLDRFLRLVDWARSVSGG